MSLDVLVRLGDLGVMGPAFREHKATQVASRLLELAGGRLDVLPLVKLVYIVDRTCLGRYGRSITMDSFYNMLNGPVVSSTMDCINAESDEDAPIWRRHIAPRTENSVRLLSASGTSELSPAEEAIIGAVFHEHGKKSIRQWIDFAHNLPEWEDPSPDKRHPVKYGDVLRAMGWAQEDVDHVVHDLTAEAKADLLFR